jgi:hypothetical protein
MFLAFLPIIGPIIQGITSIFTKAMDTKVEVLKTERGADVQEAQVSSQIIHDTQDDIGLRLMRDILCFPTVMWAFLIGWDTIIADPQQVLIPHEWMFHVANYPQTVGYLPYAVVVFLLGNIGLNIWKRK